MSTTNEQNSGDSPQVSVFKLSPDTGEPIKDTVTGFDMLAFGNEENEESPFKPVIDEAVVGKSRKPLKIVLGGLAVAVALGAAFFAGRSGDEKSTSNTAVAVEETKDKSDIEPTNPNINSLNELSLADLAPVYVDENNDPNQVLSAFVERIEAIHNSKLSTDPNVRQSLLDAVFTRGSTEDRNQMVARNEEIKNIRINNPDMDNLYYDWSVLEIKLDQVSDDGLTRTITGTISEDGPVDLATSNLSILLYVEKDLTTGRDKYLIEDILDHSNIHVENKPSAYDQ